MMDAGPSQPLAKRLATVLRNYTDPAGNVDYAAVEMADNVIEYVDALPGYDLAKLRGRDDRMAFWINAYNMISIYGALRAIKKDSRFAETGHRGLLHKAKFFFAEKHLVAGERLSLNSIEKMLRTVFKEPRIHFALVCGAESCPPLKGGLYSGADLDRELDMAAKIFIGSDKGVSLDKENRIIHLSKIFKWFGEDFGPDKAAMLRFIGRYHPESEYIAAEAERLKVKYMNYDWSLNQATD